MFLLVLAACGCCACCMCAACDDPYKECADGCLVPSLQLLASLPCCGWIDGFATSVFGRRYRPLVDDMMLPTHAPKSVASSRRPSSVPSMSGAPAAARSTACRAGPPSAAPPAAPPVSSRLGGGSGQSTPKVSARGLARTGSARSQPASARLNTSARTYGRGKQPVAGDTASSAALPAAHALPPPQQLPAATSQGEAVDGLLPPPPPHRPSQAHASYISHEERLKLGRSRPSSKKGLLGWFSNPFGGTKDAGPSQPPPSASLGLPPSKQQQETDLSLYSAGGPGAPSARGGLGTVPEAGERAPPSLRMHAPSAADDADAEVAAATSIGAPTSDVPPAEGSVPMTATLACAPGSAPTATEITRTLPPPTENADGRPWYEMPPEAVAAQPPMAAVPKQRRAPIDADGGKWSVNVVDNPPLRRANIMRAERRPVYAVVTEQLLVQYTTGEGDEEEGEEEEHAPEGDPKAEKKEELQEAIAAVAANPDPAGDKNAKDKAKGAGDEGPSEGSAMAVGTVGGTPSLMRRPSLGAAGLSAGMGGMSPSSPGADDSPSRRCSCAKKMSFTPETILEDGTSAKAMRSKKGPAAKRPSAKLTTESDEEGEAKAGAPGAGQHDDDDDLFGEGGGGSFGRKGRGGDLSPGSANGDMSVLLAAAHACNAQKPNGSSSPEPGSEAGSNAKLSAAGGLDARDDHVPNAGCFPGTSEGMGEGLSALFVHPDDDVYVLAEGGGILAEPPRTFEALAFAPRVPDATPRRKPLASAQPPPTRSREDEIIVNFASAAALGAHRTPPKVITRNPHGHANDPTAAAGGAHSSTWQMWASDDLTDAMGVSQMLISAPTAAEGEEDAPAGAPSADVADGGKEGVKGGKKDAARKEERGRKKDAKGAKGAAKADAAEADGAMHPDGQLKSPRAVERETDPGYRKMHIDYKPVLFNAARRGGKNTGGSVDGLSPRAQGAGHDADTKKRTAAAGLFNRQKQSGGARKGKA